MRSFQRVLALDVENSLARTAIAELIDDQRAETYRAKVAARGSAEPAARATAEAERPVVPIASLAPGGAGRNHDRTSSWCRIAIRLAPPSGRLPIALAGAGCRTRSLVPDRLTGAECAVVSRRIAASGTGDAETGTALPWFLFHYWHPM